MKLRSRLQTAALACASLAVTLLVLELALRALARSRGGGKEAGTIAQYTQHDPLLGWRKRPLGRALFQRREYEVEVVMNRHGQRDRERDYTKAPGSFRVLALGDSFVEAYGVPLESVFTQLLERSLDRPDCRVEVLNAGTAAYSTDQEYLYYAHEGRRYAPDVVLVFFYYNDVIMNGAARHFGTPKPLLVEREGRLLPAEDPVPEPPPWSPPAADGEAGASQRSALFEWTRERLLHGAPRSYQSLSRLGLWEPIRPVPPHDQLKVYKKKRLPDLERGWRLTALILAELARSVGAAGGRFGVAYVPSRMEVQDGDWELTRLRYGMDDALWERGLVRERLASIAVAAGFPVVDLTPSLRKADKRLLGRPYYSFDGHWNALGHRVVAKDVERFLDERGWLPSCRD